jgi:hypothetical protein
MRLLLGVLLISGCMGHNRHVFVPADARDCWASCNERAKRCEPGSLPTAEAYTDTAAVVSRERAKGRCEDQRNDCLLTCPGAYED